MSILDNITALADFSASKQCKSGHEGIRHSLEVKQPLTPPARMSPRHLSSAWSQILCANRAFLWNIIKQCTLRTTQFTFAESKLGTQVAVCRFLKRLSLPPMRIPVLLTTVGAEGQWYVRIPCSQLWYSHETQTSSF